MNTSDEYCPVCGLYWPKEWKRPINCFHKGKNLNFTYKKIKESDLIENVKKQNISHWIELHEYPVKNEWNLELAKIFYQEWRERIPNIGCGCIQNWLLYEKDNPPDFSSSEKFFEWGWKAHNYVSENHSHKPTITFEEAYNIYFKK